MNSVKKILASISGVCVLTASLCGCNITQKNYFTEMQKINSMSEFDYNASLIVQSPESSISASFVGTVSEKAISSKISLEFPEEKSVGTTVVVANDTLYLDTSQLGIPTDESSSTTTPWLSLPFSAVPELTENKVSVEDIKNADDSGIALYSASFELLRDVTSKMKTSPLGTDGDAYTLYLDNTVLEDLLTAVRSSAEAGEVDKFVAAVSSEAAKYTSEVDISSEWNKHKAEFSTELDKALASLADAPIFSVKSTVKATDESFMCRNTATYDGYTVIFNFTKSATVSDVAIPTESQPLADIITGFLDTMNNSGFGFSFDDDADTDFSFGEGDSDFSFGEEDGDWFDDDWFDDDDSSSADITYEGDGVFNFGGTIVHWGDEIPGITWTDDGGFEINL